MDEDLYIMWSGRMQGWFSTTAQYTSDREQAKKFTHDEAIRQARRLYKDGMSEFGMIPVSLKILNEVINHG